MFKIFPAFRTQGGDKQPIIPKWQERATDDPEQINLWAEIYRDQMSFWGIRTGPENGLLVLDVDVKDDDGFKSLNGHALPPTMSQRTPSGGLHYLYRYPNDGLDYSNKTKFLPGLDIRGKGGWIAHYGLDKQPLAEAPQWIMESARTKTHVIEPNSTKVAPEVAQGIIMECLEEIREAPEGTANDTLYRKGIKIAQLVASGSITEEYAKQVLHQAAYERGKSEQEATKCINSAFVGAVKMPLTSPFTAPKDVIGIPAPPTIKKWTPRQFTTHDLFNRANLRKPQIFEDWSTEDIHITTADGGTGKTTLKLFEAICLALGDRFMGFNNINGPGKTLFITGEDTKGKLGAMIGMIAGQMGVISDPVKLNMILSSIVVKKDSDFCIISKDRQGFLHPSDVSMTKLLEAVREIKPKLIVFDPISSFWGSEAALNDMAKAVGKFMSRLVIESNASVEILNHMGKSSSSNKDMSQFAGRGGSGLPSQARVSRVLRSLNELEYSEMTGKELEENQSAMLCNVNKFTDGSRLLNKPFVIVRRGYLFTREELTPKKQREIETQILDTEKVFKFIKSCRTLDKYPTKNVVIGHFMTSGDKISEARTKRALNMLEFTGHDGFTVKKIENPDALSKDHAYGIFDGDGKEV